MIFGLAGDNDNAFELFTAELRSCDCLAVKALNHSVSGGNVNVLKGKLAVVSHRVHHKTCGVDVGGEVSLFVARNLGSNVGQIVNLALGVDKSAELVAVVGSDVDVRRLDVAVENLVSFKAFENLAHLDTEVNNVLFLELFGLQHVGKGRDVLGYDVEVKLFLSLVFIGSNGYVVADSADVDNRLDKIGFVEKIINAVVVIIVAFNRNSCKNSGGNAAVNFSFGNLVDGVAVYIFEPCKHLPGFKRLG